MGSMPLRDPKEDLRTALQSARDAMVWKLDGLSEYDARRPLTPTGTNLLGLVKHLAGVELGYFGETFGRPSGESLPWLDEDAEEEADMWAKPEESREDIVGLYKRAWAHADGTFDALSVDAPGRVAWWPAERADVTLHQIMVHVTTETHRHAGHADILRELIDSTVGRRPNDPSMTRRDQDALAAHRAKIEEAARQVDTAS